MHSFVAYLSVVGLCCSSVWGQTANEVQQRSQEQERRAQEALEQRQKALVSPDVRLQGPTSTPGDRLLKAESPCFPIHALTLQSESPERWAWLLAHADGHATLDQPDPVEGRCVGAQGVQTVIDRLQNALIAKGYVTSRVLAIPQNLQTGQLQLQLILGRTHYSVPFGYWLLSLNASNNKYFQTVAGATQNYLYSGKSRQQDIKLTQLFSRDAVSKTSWSIKAFARQSENFIDDTEVEVQRRRVGGYEIGLQHKVQWGNWLLDGAIAYKRGIKAFGANEAPEEFFGEGTHQFQLWAADLQWQKPLTVAGKRWHYMGHWRWQNNRTPLTPQDRFSIGGRYTVRGFDGESSLVGERGWLVRNELSTASAETEQRVYLALDHGRVAGPSAQNLVGRKLTGFVLGLRGRLGVLHYDVFAGAPIKKPENFHTADTVAGVSLSVQF